jgi:inorganic phosphate transporter, PiT family
MTPLVAGIAGGIIAVGFAYAARVPTSMSVALVSAMVGALCTGPGLGVVHWSGVEKVGASMFLSIAVGALVGVLIYACLLTLLARVRWRTGNRLMSLQYATVALLALGYGANDLEKSIGLLAAGSAGATFTVPAWTIFAAVAFFAAGMLAGGTRVAKTVGSKLFLIRPQEALAFQLASAATVIGAALAGGPLSTTQTTASALVGVGAADDPRAVRWLVVARIVVSWFITAPIGFAAGALTGAIARLVTA